MRYRKKAIIISVLLALFALSALIFTNFDTIRIEYGKMAMYNSGKVSSDYVSFVMDKRGEMKIHEIAKFGEKRGKIDVVKQLYSQTALYYIKNKASDETLEIFCSRLDKAKYSSVRQLGYREILNKKKYDLEREFIRGIGNDSEKMQKIDSLIRYVIATDNPEKNIDLIQDIAPLIKNREQLFIVYWFLVNFHLNHKSENTAAILKLMEDDMAPKLSKKEIDVIFGRER